MPKPYPQEFRDDVVRVALDRPAGTTLEQIANDFGIHPMTLSKWLRKAREADAPVGGSTGSDTAELAAAKRRIRLLEQENEVLRRAAAYLGQASLPKGGCTRSCPSSPLTGFPWWCRVGYSTLPVPRITDG